MSFLKLPSRKVFIEHLKRQQSANTSTFDNDHQPIIGLKDSVWIQGYVVQNELDGTCAVVDDGTGTLLLIDCDKITTKIALHKGMYLMAVGSVQQLGPQPVVKPVKLQDLSQMDHVETMWPLEVIDQTRFLNK